jgi:hypothetical protein
VSYELKGDREYELDPNLRPLRRGRGRRTTIVVCIVLAVIASGAAFLWGGYGGTLEGLPIFKSEERAPQAVSSKVFQEYQQAVATNFGRDREMLQAQDAEIKRLSDQVLRLIMKMDSLERNARDAQAAVGPAPRPFTKQPAAKPAPRISTGGAPLPTTPEEKQ